MYGHKLTPNEKKFQIKGVQIKSVPLECAAEMLQRIELNCKTEWVRNKLKQSNGNQVFEFVQVNFNRFLISVILEFLLSFGVSMCVVMSGI